jgi:hypothetical protein
MENDRRASQRLAILGNLQGEVMIFQPMRITEIAPGGVQAETAFPLQIDSLHDVRLVLGDISLVTKARVAHCSIVEMDGEQVQYRAGLHFVDPSNYVQSAIIAFAEAIKLERHRPLA